jgi:hypothetical protein
MLSIESRSIILKFDIGGKGYEKNMLFIFGGSDGSLAIARIYRIGGDGWILYIRSSQRQGHDNRS